VVIQRRSAGAPAVGTVARCLLVDLDRDGIEDDAIVLRRPTRRDEAARHVLPHAHRIARQRIAPAAAAARLEAQHVAALHLGTVALPRQHALGRRPRVWRDLTRSPRAPAD
jgi:hypothetical protein